MLDEASSLDDMFTKDQELEDDNDDGDGGFTVEALESYASRVCEVMDMGVVQQARAGFFILVDVAR